MKSVDDIINEVLDIEGGTYTDDPKDSGGPTKWGWTKKSLRAMGWFGNVQDLDRQTAFDLYYKRFIINSGYQPVLSLSASVAAELVDTAVNMGEGYAGKFLQISLNAFNQEGSKYPDIVVDGIVGKGTVRTLGIYLNQRGALGEKVLLKAMNSLQGARYLELCESAPKNERFVFGWFSNRVDI